MPNPSVSRDGIQENAINDLMEYLEEKTTKETDEKTQKQITSTSSFAFVYETLSTFFAGLGSGKIRFFHDQLKYAVNDFIGLQGIISMHKNLAAFYYTQIQPHLIESQDNEVDRCSYFHDALNQIVFHCCNYMKLASADCNEIDTKVDLFLRGNDKVSLKLIFMSTSHIHKQIQMDTNLFLIT